MALHTISVLGNERLTSAEIAEMTGLPRQADLAEVPLRDLEERIARHPWIRTARVAVLPTGTLIVDVEEREVHAIVRAAHGGPAHLLDAECVPFAPAPHELTVAVDALPTLRSRAPVEMGRADPQLCEALALTELLREFAGSDHGLRPFDSASASFVSFEVLLPDPHSDLGWTLHEPSGRSVVLGNAPRDDMKERLGRLARLLDSGIGAVARASTIDLRFADQAVLRGLAPRKQVPTRRRPSADAQRRPSRGERAIRRSAQGGRT
jgi:cell division protein FtsQ